MSKATKSARKALIWLGVTLVLIFGGLAAGVATGSTSWTPGLALDLAGGRQIILTPVLEEGATQEIEESDLDQAVQIIRQRVDASGVAEAEITTQGNNIVVSLPGNPDQSTVDLVAQSAQLQFRPVLQVGNPGATAGASATPEPSASASPEASVEPSAPAEPSGEPSASETLVPDAEASETAHVVGEATDLATTSDTTAVPSPSASASASTTDEPLTTEEPATDDGAGATGPVYGETDPSSFEWLTADLQQDYAELDCLAIENYSGRSMGDPEAGYTACGSADFLKYAMGPVELSGDDLETATSGPQQTQTGSYTGSFEVRLQFTDEGAQTFDQITQRIAQLESPRNQFAMVLDGAVISAPSVDTRISGGQASITGNFTQEQAEDLANQLKFGALPLSLEVQSNQQISATLGAEQLEKGLIAGAIGLLLVVIYSIFQYRALAIVTMGSLVLAGVTTYGVITLLSWGLDYRLSLAGVAGLIVAIGITADSFIVYFERIRDELREGRSLTSAVDHAWVRARRTILASDAVSLLAAITLYMLAVGGVRGFAFTLGLTTVIDVLIVMLFTHPVMVLLAKTKFFGEGHKWSGLDPRQLGRDSMYKGRGRVRTATAAPKAATLASAESDGDVTEGLTLAERKAAQRKAAAAPVTDTTRSLTEGATDAPAEPTEESAEADTSAEAESDADAGDDTKKSEG